MVGGVLWLFDDPITAPVVMHVLLGSATPAVLYLFTNRLFQAPRAALAVGIAFALYPIAIRNSLSVLAQAPFALLLALTILALAHARDRDGDWRHALAAGVALTLASALRYEGWMLTPFLALLLWQRRGRAAIFIAAAVGWPIISMSANWLHFADPTIGINSAAHHELESVGKAFLSFEERMALPFKLAMGLVGGMTPVLVLFVCLGVLDCLARRRPQTIWLLPAVGLAALMVAAAARGSLVPKAIYTETLGLLLMPFLAAFLTAPALRRLSPLGPAAAHMALFGSMAMLLTLGVLRDNPGLRHTHSLLAAIPAVGPVPHLQQQHAVDEMVAVIRAQRVASGGALVTDSLDSPATGYLALHSGYHPDAIFMATGAPGIDNDARVPEERRDLRAREQPLLGANPPHLHDFMRRHCHGVLLLRPGSRMAALLNYQAPDRAANGGSPVQLRELMRVDWSVPVDHRLPHGGLVGPAEGEVVLFGYRVATCGHAERRYGRAAECWRDRDARVGAGQIRRTEQYA